MKIFEHWTFNFITVSVKKSFYATIFLENSLIVQATILLKFFLSISYPIFKNLLNIRRRTGPGFRGPIAQSSLLSDWKLFIACLYRYWFFFFSRLQLTKSKLSLHGIHSGQMKTLLFPKKVWFRFFRYAVFLIRINFIQFWNQIQGFESEWRSRPDPELFFCSN